MGNILNIKKGIDRAFLRFLLFSFFFSVFLSFSFFISDGGGQLHLGQAPFGENKK